MEAEQGTLIDAQTEITGKIVGRDARILGRFRGEIELTGRLTTGEGWVVVARVRAAAAEIAGELDGELHVKRLILLEKAHVEGSVFAESLSVREGANLQGAVNAGAPPPKPAGDSRPLLPGPPKPAVPIPPPKPIIKGPNAG
jgi:cytoskeletal protein CcmA (bactofilin family)